MILPRLVRRAAHNGWMAADTLAVTRTLAIPLAEVELRFSRSSGPGGQHAQRTESRVEAVFDVAASTTLSERQKALVTSRVGPAVRAVAQDERSQHRNRELALERLAAALREALRERRPRRATRPTLSSVEERLETKRHRARRKEMRRPPDDSGGG